MLCPSRAHCDIASPRPARRCRAQRTKRLGSTGRGPSALAPSERPGFAAHRSNIREWYCPQARIAFNIPSACLVPLVLWLVLSSAGSVARLPHSAASMIELGSSTGGALAVLAHPQRREAACLPIQAQRSRAGELHHPRRFLLRRQPPLRRELVDEAREMLAQFREHVAAIHPGLSRQLVERVAAERVGKIALGDRLVGAGAAP